jgi:serine/threonine protein kinase
VSVQDRQPLPEGFLLDRYRISRMLASGGFSFVYRAQDLVGGEMEGPVVLKEYFPAGLAQRLNGSSGGVMVRPEYLATFRAGLKCFFDEGGVLARVQHANVVRVLNFFRANHTVYLVMRYERGRTLQQHIEQAKAAPAEPWIRTLFLHLLNGLREVHLHRLLHLDLKPGNVYIRDDGSPLLIDFGAARQTLGGQGGQLPAMYTPGFASPEHHGERSRLGPWSDIYSVGASMYACLSGQTPQPALERMRHDRLVAAGKAWARKYSATLLEAIEQCLQLDPLKRPQSVLALQKALRE